MHPGFTLEKRLGLTRLAQDGAHAMCAEAVPPAPSLLLNFKPLDRQSKSRLNHCTPFPSPFPCFLPRQTSLEPPGHICRLLVSV